MKFLLSWVIEDKGGHTYSFNWDFLKNLLINLKNSRGSITLSIIDRETGITSLQTQAENNNYLLTLEDETEDEIDVKSYFNELGGQGQIKILGDYWDKRQVTNDYSMILDIFSQYYLTGDINRDYIK
ncbi:hypothetical protein J3U68_08025 [Snodgrassella sp. B3882]|uniref:DUF6911 family protein n=1 Tax=Snodgrassella sp. B3882 TaxID=2818037 RepID=UPI002269DB3B|nr:hypothetical protein [Snodgrassella sp. B3882]MCX8745354.1 hypothetical protein [Snodgrassella sp. B3882]